ncbi:MAG TPA: hypothetical protein VLH10_23645 [Yinghuangia sp.]|uniref:LppU/SCO3897 family protein n=1 Tax=Yinghuangia sp. YIM S10712 TaxID=3436930 RepID=UPI002C39595A|nr:hypothetical protein [Yinghuangia sp.]
MSPGMHVSRKRLCAVAVGVTVMLGGLVACGDDDDKGNPFTPPSMPTFPTATPSLPTGLPTALPSDLPTTLPTGIPTGIPTGTGRTGTRTPTSDEPTSPRPKTSNFASGECLAGSIETTGTQDELTEVPCSDPEATFKVLRTFPYQIGSQQCSSVSGTDYSYHEYMTLNGVPTGTGTTYCLQEL